MIKSVVNFFARLGEANAHDSVAVLSLLTNSENLVSGAEDTETTPCPDQRFRLY